MPGARGRGGARPCGREHAVTINTNEFPPEVFSIRGQADITEVEGIVPAPSEASRVLPNRDRLAEVKEVAGVVRPLDVDEARVVVAVVRTAPALQVGIREAGVDG